MRTCIIPTLTLAFTLASVTACPGDDGTSSGTDGMSTQSSGTPSTESDSGEPQDCSQFEPEDEGKLCKVIEGQDTCPEHYYCHATDDVNGIPEGACKWNQTTCPIIEEPETTTGLDPSGSGGSDSGGNGSGSTTTGEDSFLDVYCTNLCACKEDTGEDPGPCEAKCANQDQPCAGQWALYVICLHGELGQDFCNATACIEELAEYNTCVSQN